jgi:hypothetical protein
VLPGLLYSANLTWNNNGTLSLNTAPLVDYTAVQQQNELFTDFTAGFTLLAGSEINLSFAVSGTLDYHTISFSNTFGASGGTFTWGFDIIQEVAGRFQLSTKASLLQTVGSASSNLDFVDNNSNLYNLHFVQNGANVDTGSTSLNFLPDTTSLAVTDQVIVSGPFGSDTGRREQLCGRSSCPRSVNMGDDAGRFCRSGFRGPSDFADEDCPHRLNSDLPIPP